MLGVVTVFEGWTTAALMTGSSSSSSTADDSTSLIALLSLINNGLRFITIVVVIFIDVYCNAKMMMFFIQNRKCLWRECVCVEKGSGRERGGERVVTPLISRPGHPRMNFL